MKNVALPSTSAIAADASSSLHAAPSTSNRSSPKRWSSIACVSSCASVMRSSIDSDSLPVFSSPVTVS